MAEIKRDVPPPSIRAPGERRGFSALLLLALLVLVAALLAWAYLKTPPTTPDPAKTAIPETVPNAAPPTAQP